MAEAATSNTVMSLDRAADPSAAGASRGAARLALPVVGALRRARSASLSVGSAAAFLLFAALLSFVPDAKRDDGVAWQLRGSLPAPDLPPPVRQYARQAAS